MKKQSGFTLIELVAVIVILAILAVTAVPQFIDLRVNAANASAAGFGGAISSATTLNYARGVATGTASAVTSCTDTLLPQLIGYPSGTTIVGGPTTYTLTGPAVATGQTAVCTITPTASPAGAAQTYTIIGCTGVGGC